MSNQPKQDATDEAPAFPPVVFSPVQERIAEIDEQAKTLPAVVDKKSRTAVASFQRTVIGAARADVERMRKALKASALEYGRRVDDEAKRITSEIDKIAAASKEQLDAYDAEQARIAREAELKAEANRQAVADAFSQLRDVVDRSYRTTETAALEALQRELCGETYDGIDFGMRRDEFEAERSQTLQRLTQRLADVTREAKERAEQERLAVIEQAERELHGLKNRLFGPGVTVADVDAVINQLQNAALPDVATVDERLQLAGVQDSMLQIATEHREKVEAEEAARVALAEREAALKRQEAELEEQRAAAVAEAQRLAQEAEQARLETVQGASLELRALTSRAETAALSCDEDALIRLIAQVDALPLPAVMTDGEAKVFKDQQQLLIDWVTTKVQQLAEDRQGRAKAEEERKAQLAARTEQAKTKPLLLAMTTLRQIAAGGMTISEVQATAADTVALIDGVAEEVGT